MGRFGGGSSYGHSVRPDGNSVDWVISWTVDYYYPDSRLRFPRTFRRFTDRAGAERFAKRWGLEMPPKWGIRRERRGLPAVAITRWGRDFVRLDEGAYVNSRGGPKLLVAALNSLPEEETP